ncbi:MAG: hypothetical protein LBJ80_01550 [Rickettsiales bacterium]|jgi:hypothetical protein|nr:hypothetical protein [Rickettsiales bacterium]MDR1261092.1 hypothetical protein [Rickettsiales bacterium]
MDDPFKSGNYNKNLNSLIQVIKLKDTKKIDKQYNETVRDLSQALKGFTNKAEDVAKFVIYTDLNNYVEPVDKKPLGLFGTLKEIWDTILGKDVPVKNDNIRNFVKDKLPNPALEKAAEYTNILRKVNLLKEKFDTLKEILDSGRSEKEEHKPHEVNLESKTTPKQRKGKQSKESASNRMKKVKRPAPPPPTSTVLDSQETSLSNKADRESLLASIRQGIPLRKVAQESSKVNTHSQLFERVKEKIEVTKPDSSDDTEHNLDNYGDVSDSEWGNEKSEHQIPAYSQFHNEKDKSHEVNLESPTTSKQKKEELPKKESASNRMKKIKRPTTAPPLPPTAPNELKPEPQKKVATTEKKKVRFKSKPEVILFDDSGYGSLSDEESDKEISNYQEKESIYATVPKEHIEAKRASKQQQQSKPPIPLKPSIAPPMPKKMFATDQEARQKPKADQQVSTKPRIVGMTPKKSAESKPTVPLKKVADKAAPKVKVVAMKEEVNSKKDGRIKSMVGKIEQDQAAESKATPAAQADIGVKKDPAPSPKAASQSHSFPAGNERSEMNPITAKSDPKPKVKDPPLTHVNVKQIAARFESHGKK